MADLPGFTPLRKLAQALMLGWAVMHLIGGAVISLLPLAVLPFEPEQSLYHYSFHVLYGITQIPLLTVLWLRRRAR